MKCIDYENIIKISSKALKRIALDNNHHRIDSFFGVVIEATVLMSRIS